MTAVCAASGCNARPAARGLCTRHLGIDPNRPTKTARPRAVFVDTIPSRFHTIDTETVRTLSHNPGRWARYPAEARWTDWQILTPQRKASRLNGLTTRVRRSRAAFAGFVWEAERRDRDLYVRCIGPDLSITDLKKPA